MALWCCLSDVCTMYWPTHTHSIKRMLGTKDVRKLKTHTQTRLCRHCECVTLLQYIHVACVRYLVSCVCRKIVERKLKRSIEFSAKRCWWLSWWQSMCALLSSFSFFVLSLGQSHRIYLSVCVFGFVCIIGFCRLCLITSFYVCGIDLWVYFVITQAKNDTIR